MAILNSSAEFHVRIDGEPEFRRIRHINACTLGRSCEYATIEIDFHDAELAEALNGHLTEMTHIWIVGTLGGIKYQGIVRVTNFAVEARCREIVKYDVSFSSFGIDQPFDSDWPSNTPTIEAASGMPTLALGPTAPAVPQKPTIPQICRGCANFHGKTYGGNMLICAMHPYGPDAEECPDEEPVKFVGDSSSYYWRLEDKVPVACSPEEWGIYFDRSDRQIAETHVGQVRVSTVFLGLNHNFTQQGPPILFETMCFGDCDFDEYNQVRYCTYNEAEAGHEATVQFVRRLVEAQ